MRKGVAIGGMIGTFVLGLAFGAAAVGGGSHPGLAGASSSPSSSVAAAAATPAPTPLALSGTGSKVIDPLTLASGNYRVAWSAQGNDNFIVHVHGANGADDGLINEIPPNPSSGEAFFQAGGGNYVLEVKAGTLAWTITFAPVTS